MNIDVGKLALFVKLAEVGSLTKAATLLGTSTSALSRRIGQLEERCGAPLFYRTGRGLVLSELGTRLLPGAQRLLLEAADIEVEIGNAAGIPAGVVHLGMLQAAADPLLTVLLRRLRDDYPAIRLRVTEGNSNQLEAWLALGTLDIALLVREKGALSDGERPLSLNPLQLIMRRDDPLASREQITFRELATLPLMLPAFPNGMFSTLMQAARRLGLELDVRVEIESLALQKQLVAAGLGYCIGSRGFIKPDDILVGLPIVEPVMERAMILASTTQRPLTLSARTVLDLTHQIAAELSGQGIWRGIPIRPKREAAQR